MTAQGPGALPGRLPEGERILWQGRPEWRGLFRDALHGRGLTLYLGGVVLAVAAAASMHGLEVAVRDTAVAALVAAVPFGLAMGYAWAAARAASYTITNRRVVLQLGVALPMSMNLPFARITAADLRARADGSGEIRLSADTTEGLYWMALWPHVRFGRTAPVLRALPDAAAVGQLLARALAAASEAPVPLAPELHTGQTAGHGHATMAA